MFVTTRPAISGLHDVFYRIRRELVRFAEARTGDGAEAEDIVQDVWLLLETREISSVANPRAYLFQMAHNVILDRQRTQRRRQQRDRRWFDWRTDFTPPDAELRDPDCNIEARVIAREEASVLHRAIAALPPGARTVLSLHKIDGLSQSEIAERLAISRSGVQKHLAVAMRHLRKMLIDQIC